MDELKFTDLESRFQVGNSTLNQKFKRWCRFDIVPHCFH